MKDLTEEEFHSAPHLVQYLYVMGITDTPIGSNILDKAITEHPEYFPDEVELERKWSLVPEDVHKAYNKENSALFQDMMFQMPESKGILYFAKNPKESEKWSRLSKEVDKKFKPLRKALHDKYYAKYGIKYNGS